MTQSLCVHVNRILYPGGAANITSSGYERSARIFYELAIEVKVYNTSNYLLVCWCWIRLHAVCDVSGKQERRLLSHMGHLSWIWAVGLFDQRKADTVTHQYNCCGFASGFHEGYGFVLTDTTLVFYQLESSHNICVRIGHLSN